MTTCPECQKDAGVPGPVVVLLYLGVRVTPYTCEACGHGWKRREEIGAPAEAR